MLGNGKRDLPQQLDQPTGTHHIDGTLQVVGVDRQGHFRPSALQLSEQEATITQNPLLQVAEGMFDDGSAPDHHLWMRLHPLMHALECGLMDMPSHVSALGLGAA